MRWSKSRHGGIRLFPAMVGIIVALAFSNGELHAQQTIQITDTADDCYERNSVVYGEIASEVYSVRNSVLAAGQRIPGFRFPGLNVPRGANITGATFEGYINAASDLRTTIYGHNSSNAPNFVDTADIDGRSRTTANVPVSQVYSAGVWTNIDVTNIIQEIVNGPGWTSGNAVALLLIPITHTGTDYEAYFDDINTNALNGAKLTVSYSGTNDVLLDDHYLRQVPDQFNDLPTQSDTYLYRFALFNNTAGTLTVDQIVFHLSSITGISDDTGDLTDLKIHIPGGTVVVSGGTVLINEGGGTGTITFTTNWDLPASTGRGYTLTGDLISLVAGDTMTVSMGTGDVLLTSGTVGGASPPNAVHTFGAVPPTIVFSDYAASGARPLRYSAYSGGTWSAAATAHAGPFTAPGYALHWKAGVTRADRNQAAVTFQEHYPPGIDRMYGTVWDGSNWDDGTGGAPGDYQSFGQLQEAIQNNVLNLAVAYEQLSGDLMAMGGTSNEHATHYWLCNGSAWTTFQSLGFGTIGGYPLLFDWIHLAPRPGTDQIGFIGIANEGTGWTYSSVDVAIWNGSSWTNAQTVGWPAEPNRSNYRHGRYGVYTGRDECRRSRRGLGRWSIRLLEILEPKRRLVRDRHRGGFGCG